MKFMVCFLAVCAMLTASCLTSSAEQWVNILPDKSAFQYDKDSIRKITSKTYVTHRANMTTGDVHVWETVFDCTTATFKDVSYVIYPVKGRPSHNNLKAGEVLGDKLLEQLFQAVCAAPNENKSQKKKK